MSYYFTKTVNASMDKAFDKVSEELKKEGFGVVTDFNLSAALKNKLNLDYKQYRILGACNPPFAKKVLALDDRIGVLLPCNVILQERENGIEVTAINPVKALGAVENEEIAAIAKEVQEKLERVINSL